MKRYADGLTVILALCLAFSLLSGCAASNKTQSDPFFEKWQAKAQDTKGYSPKSQTTPDTESGEKPRTTPESAPLEPSGPKLPTIPVTLSMNDVPIAAVLRALAKSAGQSIIISDSVEGTANISAVNIPWDTVFLGILNTYGLVYEQTGKVLTIKTPGDLDKDWEKQKAELRQQQLKQQMQNTEAFETQIFFIQYTDAASMKEVLSNLVQGTNVQSETATTSDTGTPATAAQQASVTVDTASNAVLVHASKEKIRQVDQIIKQLDRPTRQILIEAQIVETSQDTARALGIQWGGLEYDKSGNTLNWIGGPMDGYDGSLFTESVRDGTTGELTYPGGDAITYQPGIGSIVNFPADLSDDIGMTLGYQLQNLSSNYILTMELSALQKEGKLNILSSPSITTLDNQVASIESGREVPYQTVETAGGQAVTQIEFKKAVLSLKVTPHIIDAKMLRLNVLTHKDELDFTNAVLGNPTIITKNAETNVILFNGQTMVIGGLSKETTSNGESGVPFLKDIPLVGNLFKGTSRSGNMEEVLIFITPHILKEKSESDDASDAGAG